jgi:hypothetical protein
VTQTRTKTNFGLISGKNLPATTLSGSLFNFHGLSSLSFFKNFAIAVEVVLQYVKTASLLQINKATHLLTFPGESATSAGRVPKYAPKKPCSLIRQSPRGI